MNERWPKEQRLRKRAEFDRVYAARRSARQGEFVVFVIENGLEFNRVGFSVGRRVGSAVRRNAVRRRLREAFRRNKGAFGTGLDVVVVVLADTREKPKESGPTIAKLVERASKKATGNKQ